MGSSEKNKYRLISRDADSVRVALAGLGRMGSNHIKALLSLGRGESEEYYKSGLGSQISKIKICAACDKSPEKKGLLPEGIPFYEDWDKLLSEIKTDIAVISTPTKTHFKLASTALKAGVHTFVEKPIAVRSEECRELFRISKKHGCRLMSGHVERYNPAAIKLRSIFSEGLLDAEGYSFRRTQPHDKRIPDDIITDKVIHDLDLAMYLFGKIEGHELADARIKDGSIQEATVLLRHEKGLEGSLFVSWLQPGEGKCREVRIACRSASSLFASSIYGNFSAKRLFLDGNELDCGVPSWVRPDNNQVKDELADFVSYCMRPDPSLPLFSPLLSPPEIKTSVGIIESLLDDGHKMLNERLVACP
ncbi:MAG: Gfo/Idh/MocA family oxidoreductase [Victivallales bacterium]|nr:Gfo/Idh/MocA family oxidoreductase [Victivallales bacterium]